jgi:hypothetical protein
MSEKDNKSNRKSMKEELDEGKRQIVLTLNEKGGVNYQTGDIKPPEAINAMRTVIDDLLIRAAASMTMHQLMVQEELAQKGLMKQ